MTEAQPSEINFGGFAERSEFFEGEMQMSPFSQFQFDEQEPYFQPIQDTQATNFNPIMRDSSDEDEPRQQQREETADDPIVHRKRRAARLQDSKESSEIDEY